MGKAKAQVAPRPPAPITSVNPAGDAQTQAYRTRAATAGLNFEDTILGGSFNQPKRDDLLGAGL